MTSAVSPSSSSSVASSRRGLRITLWVLQVALALFFMMVGYSHALAPFDQVAQQATWMQHVPRALSLFIGYAELAGGLGLIVFGVGMSLVSRDASPAIAGAGELIVKLIRAVRGGSQAA